MEIRIGEGSLGVGGSCGNCHFAQIEGPQSGYCRAAVMINAMGGIKNVPNNSSQLPLEKIPNNCIKDIKIKLRPFH